MLDNSRRHVRWRPGGLWRCGAPCAWVCARSRRIRGESRLARRHLGGRGEGGEGGEGWEEMAQGKIRFVSAAVAVGEMCACADL